MGLIVAPLIAVIVSIIELTVRRDKGLYRRAIPLCILYVVFDAAAALILFVILRAGAKELEGSPTTASAVTAGLVAPLLMRTSIPVPFLKGKQTTYAVATLRRLQIRVKGQIDDLCAAGETAWILDKVLPSVNALPLLDVKAWVIQSINVKYSEPGTRRNRDECIQEVERVVADHDCSEYDRKHLMIQILIDNCGRHQVLALVKRAKEAVESGGHPSADEKPQTIEPQPRIELAGAPVDPEIDDPFSDDSGNDAECELPNIASSCCQSSALLINAEILRSSTHYERHAPEPPTP